MTNLEALQGSVNFPIDDLKFEKALLDNGLASTDKYIVPVTKPFDLATAAIYILLGSTPNIQEGDYQLSVTEKSKLIQFANAIYAKYNLRNPFSTTPKIRDRSRYR